MTAVRRLTVFALALMFFVSSVGCDAIMSTTDAEASPSDESDEHSEPMPSEQAEDTDDHRPSSLNGSDTDAFDDSWHAINEEHS